MVGGRGIRFLGHEGQEGGRATGEVGVEPREEGKVGDRGKDGTQHLGVPDKETDVPPYPGACFSRTWLSDLALRLT